MRTKASIYIATSLDGYIARLDGSIDWLDEASVNVPKDEDLGYYEFMESIDMLVLGRKSYEKVLTFGDWPYGQTPVVVLSRNEISFPSSLPDIVSHSSESPGDLLARLSEEGVKKIYVDGGVTIQRFLQAGLIDELIVTVIPILLGGGIPLFGSLDHDVKLTHVKTRAFDFGFVQTTYLVKSDS